MDRIRQLGDAIKNRYSKPCCIKVSVGIALALVLVVVIVVVAVTVGGGGEGGGGEGGGSNDATSREKVTAKVKTNTDTNAPAVTEQPRPQTMIWPHQFAVQLTSQRFSQTLAVDDVSRRYVIEIKGNQFYILYIIVDFQKRQHTYVIQEKSENDVTGEKRKVLYCGDSPFANDYDGAFTPSATLRGGGKSYEVQVSGRTVKVNAEYTNKPYTVTSLLSTILHGSCGDLPPDMLFQWDSKLSECGGNTTLAEDTPVCSSAPCPRFQKASSSTQQACDSFRKCNYVMSACDSSWAQSYDQRPYCACRRNVVDDVSNVNCNGGGECKKISDFEKMAACYCRYRISRIYPKVKSGSSEETVNWEIKATVRTAPIRSFDKCPC